MATKSQAVGAVRNKLDVKNGDVVSISSSICKKLYDKRQTLNLDL